MAVLNVILVLAGLLTVGGCLLLCFSPYGESLKGRTQKFKGFGLELEVSLLAALFLFGVALAIFPLLTPLYLKTEEYKKQLEVSQQKLGEFQSQLSAATGEIESLRRTLTQGQRFTVTALVSLDGIVQPTEMPKLVEVECKYYLYDTDQPVRATVEPGLRWNQYRVTLKDVAYKSVIRRLVFEDRSRHRSWVQDNFSPFEPFLKLNQEG